MSDDHDEEQPPIPTSADVAASQKALSSINSNGNEEDSSANVDKDALSAAVKAAESNKKPVAKQPVVMVKVDDKDVKILIDQFEFSKAKATELLRKYNADLRATATAVIRGEA